MSSPAHERFTAWIAAYERAWRAPGTDRLAELFTPDAGYRAAPFNEPVLGLEAIAHFWEAERTPDEAFTVQAEIVVAEGDIAVARLEVSYSKPLRRTYRDLWIIALAADGRCRRFEEWPFVPEQGRTGP